MCVFVEKHRMHEVSPAITRQYIDASAVFEALEEAVKDSESVRGGMYWHSGPPANAEARYLVRTTPTGAETSLGRQTPETQAIYDNFMRRKGEAADRVSGLKAALEQQRRLNRAHRVGRVEPLVVELLKRLESSKLSEHFRVVGTHALYAYESAAGVRVDADAVATRDIDLLWDTQKRIVFFTQLARLDSSMLGVLKKVDSTFRIRKSQQYTAVNKDGFEVDIIRRERINFDPHPIKLSAEDEDFWVVQAPRANVLLDAPGFSAVIVATDGSMARMNTVHPATFAKFKRWMSAQSGREAIKRKRDLLQANIVEEMLQKYLPQRAIT